MFRPMLFLALPFIFINTAHSQDSKQSEGLITLKDYINHIRSEIYGLRAENSEMPLYLAEPMKLELTIGFKHSGNGGVDIYVFSMEGKAEQFNTQKITVSLSLLGDEIERVERPNKEDDTRTFADLNETDIDSISEWDLPYGWNTSKWAALDLPEKGVDALRITPRGLPTHLESPTSNTALLGMLYSGEIENIESAEVFDSFGNPVGQVVGIHYDPEATWSVDESATLLIEPFGWNVKAKIVAEPGSWARQDGRIELVRGLTDSLDIQ